MPTFEVKFRVRGPAEYDETLVREFYSRYDGLLAWHDSQLYMTLGYDLPNGESCKDLVVEIERLFRLEIMEADLDLVDIPEIAVRVGRSRQSIHQFVTGSRRQRYGKPFPRPLTTLSGKRIWDWGSVAEWLRDERVLGDEEPQHLTREQLYALNTWLCRRATLPPEEQYDVEFGEMVEEFTAPFAFNLSEGISWESFPRLNPLLFATLTHDHFSLHITPYILQPPKEGLTETRELSAEECMP